MNESELRTKFPNASASFIRQNLQAGAEVSHPEQRECAPELDRDYAGEAQGTGCVLVVFTLRRVRLLDVDAKYSSVKDLLDCLVSAGVVAGDKEGQIDLQVWQEKVEHFKDEETIVEVIP